MPEFLPLRRRVSLVLLALAAVLVGLAPPGPLPAASAGTVPTSECARRDVGVHRGVCVRDARGGIFWLGTLRGYDGVELYCIDYAFATNWGVAHQRTLVTGELTTSVGSRVGRATVAALNFLVTRFPADRADDVTAAAIALIIRQAMGDVRRGSTVVIPGGLTVATRVKDVGFVPDRVIARARVLWDRARVERGPWQLRVRIEKGSDGVVSVGERVTAVVTATNGSGHRQPTTVGLRYRGFTGPASVALGSDGRARVRMRAPATPTRGTVTVRVDHAPGTAPLVIRPTGWVPNPRPGHSSRVSQRGLVGRQAATTASAATSVRIIRSQPVLSTQASEQRAVVGAALHDTVVLTGAGPDYVGSFTWSLLGPVPATDGTCPGPGAAAWTGAPVVASGEVAVRGDGTYRTPEFRVGAAGCFTYTESMAGSTLTLPASSPPGIPAETVLVTRPVSTPCVSTVVSRQRALVGDRLFDHVRIGCLDRTDRVRVHWTLHGPVAPRVGLSGPAGCRGIAAAAWRRAPVRATGVLRSVGPGIHRTRPVLVRAPGCYTYSERLPATALTTAVATPPGLVLETALVSRPPLVTVPDVPTGPIGLTDLVPVALRAGAGAVGASLPTDPTQRSVPRQRAARTPRAPAGVLAIPRLQAVAPILRVGTRGGSMAVPDSPALLGWLRGTAAAGDVVGASVLAGHVSDRRDRPGPLAGLGRLRAGDRLIWTEPGGARHRFRVVGLHRFSRARGLPARLFRTDGPRVLHLITCTGRVVRGGRFHYSENLVVTATVAR